MPPDTKALISETFREMVRQKGIDKVTVKSLIDACQISRQTFYYHFQDIMEVIQWSMEQAAQNNLSRITPSLSSYWTPAAGNRSRKFLSRPSESIWESFCGKKELPWYIPT